MTLEKLSSLLSASSATNICVAFHPSAQLAGDAVMTQRKQAIVLIVNFSSSQTVRNLGCLVYGCQCELILADFGDLLSH